MSLSNQIQSLNDKLQQLLKQYQAVQKDNQRLMKENNQLKEKYDKQIQQMQQLQQKVETRNIISSGLPEEVKKDLEKRIQGYLKEIDKCLTLLNG